MDIEQRFERLERENRRLKLAGAAVVAVLLAVALVGAVMPQEIPEIVEARQFRVIDENGERRAMMSTDGIAYFDENVQMRGLMYTDGITYYDENGQWRSTMETNRIAYFDENGQWRGQMIRRYGHLVDEDTADLAALLEPSATESATERFRGRVDK